MFHLAAQVAVTTSLADPRDDFEVNARGHVQRSRGDARAPIRPPLARLHLDEQGLRGAAETSRSSSARRATSRATARVRATGIDESRRSTSTARTAARRAPPTSTSSTTRASSALPTVVFRMSCIYGPHQFGTEDQGWVAHFLIRALDGEPITVYGDGKQVRDVLFVEDLVDALTARRRHRDESSPARRSTSAAARRTRVSLLELLDLLRTKHGELPPVRRRRLAHGRPALLRLGHPQAAGGNRVASARRRRARAWGGSTTGCVESARGARARPRPRAAARRFGAWRAELTRLPRCVAAVHRGAAEDPGRRGSAARAGNRGGAREARGMRRLRLEPPAVGGHPWFAYPLGPGAPGHEGWGSVEAVGLACAWPARATGSPSSPRAPTREYDVGRRDSVRRPAGRPRRPAVPRRAARLRDERVPAQPRAARVRRWRSSGVGFLGALLARLCWRRGSAGPRDLAPPVRARPRPPVRGRGDDRARRRRRGRAA